jgi:hypothetical protein
MAARIILIYFGLLTMSVVSCDNDLEPDRHSPPTEPALNAVLRTNGGRQKLLLTNVKHVDSLDFTFIQNVPVRIDSMLLQNLSEDSIGRSGTAQQLDTFYNYYSDALNIIPGNTYELNVAFDPPIQGETRVPQEFTITAGGGVLRWNNAGTLYRVLLNGPVIDEFVTADTAYAYANIDNFTRGTYLVTIEAYDENLARFLLKESLSSGLMNAYGVFGSIHSKKMNVNLR